LFEVHLTGCDSGNLARQTKVRVHIIGVKFRYGRALLNLLTLEDKSLV